MNKKTSGLVASLLLLGGIATFSDPRPFLLESTGGNKEEFTAITNNGSSFQFEYDESTNSLDNVKEWLTGIQQPSTYEGANITPEQKKFFTDMTAKFLQYESDKVLSAFKRNPRVLEFYNPFSTEAKNGRAVFYLGDMQYKVTEGNNGDLSFYVGVPSHRWGEPSVDYVNLKDVSASSPFYSEIKSLVDKVTAQKTDVASNDYSELRELLPNVDF
jgi:hypothetical protein